MNTSDSYEFRRGVAAIQADLYVAAVVPSWPSMVRSLLRELAGPQGRNRWSQLLSIVRSLPKAKACCEKLKKQREFKQRLNETMRATLENGLDPEKVRDHFSEKKKAGAVEEYLARFLELSGSPLHRASKLRDTFFGYTIIEVEGAFARASKGQMDRAGGLGTASTSPEVVIEPAYLVRVFFKPNVQQAWENAGGTGLAPHEYHELAKHFLRQVSNSAVMYTKARGPVLRSAEVKVVPPPGVDDLGRKFLTQIEEWSHDAGLFMFGYLVFEMCDMMEKEFPEEQREDEIWIASLWNCSINRVEMNRG